MFDHIGFNVKDFARSKEFYTKALAPLGVTVTMEGDGWAIIGKGGKNLWFGSYGTVPSSIHIAFTADTRAQVEAFYKAALAAGGTDNGAPGVRNQYSPYYYAAFVYDPDGHNVEAVCQRKIG